MILDYFYSSFQLRAINTLKFIQDTLRDKRKPIRAWQLNERHYGALTGLNKDEMKENLVKIKSILLEDLGILSQIP